MKKLLYIGLLAGLSSCGPRMYTYQFSMKESKKANKLHYENDTISISFNFSPKGIKVDFVNKSDSVIRINWNEMSLTENGIAKKVVPVKRDKGKLKVIQSPSLISPKAKASGLLVYEYNVCYSKNSEQEITTIKDMYPVQSKNAERRAVEKLVGTRLTFHLPMEIHEVSYQPTFNFLLAGIASNRMIGAGDFLLLPLYMLAGF